MVAGAYFPKAGRTHEPKKEEAGSAVAGTLVIGVTGREDLMPGLFNRSMALQFRLQYPIQIGGIPFELPQIAVCIVAGESHRQDESCVTEQVIFHIRFVGHLVFGAGENLPGQSFDIR